MNQEGGQKQTTKGAESKKSQWHNANRTKAWKTSKFLSPSFSSVSGADAPVLAGLDFLLLEVASRIPANVLACEEDEAKEGERKREYDERGRCERACKGMGSRLRHGGRYRHEQ